MTEAVRVPFVDEGKGMEHNKAGCVWMAVTNKAKIAALGVRTGC